MLNNIQFPKGGIILWEGKVINGQLQAAIPNGWEEVTSMRGRVAVGWTNGEFDYNFYNKFSVLGEPGGTAMVSLTAENNGPHTHDVFFERYPKGYNANPGYDGGNNRYDININRATSSSGSGKPHENTQPYRVLIYIRATKGA